MLSLSIRKFFGRIMRSIQYSVFSFQEGMPSKGSAFPGDVLGAPHSDAGNSRAERKEPASCWEVFSAQYSVFRGITRRGLRGSQVWEVFSAQYSVFRGITRIGVRGSQENKLCDNLRKIKLFLLPTAFSLLPQSKTEFDL